MTKALEKWDLFISHASEDKDFVRPLVAELQSRGMRVWYDEFTLKVGSSLRRSIETGLAHTSFGVVVVSRAFLRKEWPQRELDALFAREKRGRHIILPIWHGVTASDVTKISPLLADRLATSSTQPIQKIADDLVAAIRASSRRQVRRQKKPSPRAPDKTTLLRFLALFGPQGVYLTDIAEHFEFPADKMYQYLIALERAGYLASSLVMKSGGQMKFYLGLKGRKELGERAPQ